MFIHSLPLYWLMVYYRLAAVVMYQRVVLGQQQLRVGVRSRDDMDRDDLAHALGRRGAGVGSATPPKVRYESRPSLSSSRGTTPDASTARTSDANTSRAGPW